MKNKDKQLTDEKLKELYKKMAEFIEKARNTTPLCENEECHGLDKPDYEELLLVESLSAKIYELEQENKALRHSLVKMYVELENSQTRENIWKEDYYKEHSRAEKLYNELNELMENTNETY